MLLTNPKFRKTIVVLLYIFLLLMFLSAPFRRLHPLVKQFHVLYGFAFFCVLSVIHLLSVFQGFSQRIKKRQKSSMDKWKIGTGIGLIIMMILMIITAYTRKSWAIITADGKKWEPIREFHTFYGPILLSIIVIIHVYVVTRLINQQTSEVSVRKDYKGFFPAFLVSFLIVVGVSLATMFVQNIARRGGG